MRCLIEIHFGRTRQICATLMFADRMLINADMLRRIERCCPLLIKYTKTPSLRQIRLFIGSFSSDHLHFSVSGKVEHISVYWFCSFFI